VKNSVTIQLYTAPFSSADVIHQSSPTNAGTGECDRQTKPAHAEPYTGWAKKPTVLAVCNSVYVYMIE